MNQNKKLVSILVVNFNGYKWLEDCFTSLYKQTYKNIEIIFVDNNSKDNSVDFVKQKFPDVKIVNSNENLGFAGGNNLGLVHCLGDYIYLLNNDTYLEPDCILELVNFLEDNPKVGSAQSKMIQMHDKKLLDVVGAYWTFTGFLYYYGANAPEQEAKFNKKLKVYSNKGASMILRRSAIEEIGFFDSDFWCYYEEGDLCTRLWIAGYECWYVPAAVMYHAGGGTSLTFKNSFIQFHNFKNKLQSALKCYQLSTLLKVLPIYLLLNITISFYWLAKGKLAHSFSLYKAIWWNLVNIRKILKKRDIVQLTRRKRDIEIFQEVQRHPRLGYYLSLLTGANWTYED